MTDRRDPCADPANTAALPPDAAVTEVPSGDVGVPGYEVLEDLGRRGMGVVDKAPEQAQGSKEVGPAADVSALATSPVAFSPDGRYLGVGDADGRRVQLFDAGGRGR